MTSSLTAAFTALTNAADAPAAPILIKTAFILIIL